MSFPNRRVINVLPCGWPSCDEVVTDHETRMTHILSHHLKVASDLQCALLVCYLCPTPIHFSTEEEKCDHTLTFHHDATCFDPTELSRTIQNMSTQMLVAQPQEFSAASQVPLQRGDEIWCHICQPSKSYLNKATYKKHMNQYHPNERMNTIA